MSEETAAVPTVVLVIHGGGEFRQQSDPAG